MTEISSEPDEAAESRPAMVQQPSRVPIELRIAQWARPRLRRGVEWLHSREARLAAAFVALATLVTLVNFQGVFSVHFIDNSWPQDPVGSLQSLFYAWGPDRLGYLNLLGPIAIPTTAFAAGLQLVGIPSGVQEILLLILLQSVALLYSYRTLSRYLLQPVEPRLREPLSVVGSVILVTSFYVQTVYWWDFLPDGFLLLAAGSVLLYYLAGLLEGALEGRAPTPRRVLVVAAVSTLSFSVNIPFNLSLLFLVFSLPTLAVIARGGVAVRRWVWLRFQLLVAGMVAVTSLWWLLPSAEFASLSPSYVTTQSPSINSQAIFVSSTSGVHFVDLLRGAIGYPYLAQGHYSLTTAVYADAGVPLSFLFLIVLGGGLLLWRRKEHSPLLLCTALLLLLALFILGVNSPLYPQVFGFLFQSPVILTALRTPFVALGLAFEELWVCAMCLAVSSCYGWLRAEMRPRVATDGAGKAPPPGLLRTPLRSPRWLGPLLAALLLLVPAVALAPAAWAGDAVPVTPYESRQQVAPYERAVANFLRTNLDGRVAMLYPGGFLEQNWTRGYDGYDILPSLLPGAILVDNYREGFVVANNSLLTLAYSTLESGNSQTSGLSGLLARLGVGYLVIEGEVGGYFPFGQSTPPNYPVLLASLNSTANLTLAAVIGPDFLYAVAAPRGLVSLVTTAVSDANLVQAEIEPSLNLTSAFFNSTRIESATVPFPAYSAEWDGAINFSVSPAQKASPAATEAAANSPWPGPITLVNGYPLDLPVSPGDELLLNFSTNLQTAISVSIITATTISGVAPTSVPLETYSVGAPADNLGSGDPTLVPAYGANHFVSPGRFTLLTDDLAATLRGIANPTIHFLAVSLWPVQANGTGTRGVPVQDWQGTQSVRISSLELGANVFLAPPAPPTSPFVGGGLPTVPPQDLLPSIELGLRTNTTLAPAHNLFVDSSNGTDELRFGSAEKANWTTRPLAPPFPAFGEPTYFTANALGLEVNTTEFLTLTLRSSQNTAFTLALLPARNLSSLSPGQLDAQMLYLGGSASTVGGGDPLLAPTYGGEHFDTNGSTLTFTEEFSALSPAAPAELNHLVVELFYVAPNGSGVRGLSPSDWPGTEAVFLDSATASPYLLDGQPPTGPTLSLAGTRLLGVAPSGLPSGSASLPGPAPQLDQNVSLVYSYPSPTEFVVQLHSTDAAASGRQVLLELSQTYFGGWTIADPHGIVSWSHVELDGALNGFLVNLSQGASVSSFEIVFSPQTLYEVSLLLGILVPVAIGAMLWLPPRIRRRFSA
jgi:hypothetical protein